MNIREARRFDHELKRQHKAGMGCPMNPRVQKPTKKQRLAARQKLLPLFPDYVPEAVRHERG